MSQRSSIEKLPEDILLKLQELLRDSRITQLAIVQKINALLNKTDNQKTISKSALNRYKKRMDKVGSKISEMREIAKVWSDKFGTEPAGKVGMLLNEIIRNLAVETALQAAEGDQPIAPKMLKDLSIAVERLEKAANENLKREKEIKASMAAQAKEKIKELENKGFDKTTLQASIKAVYGIIQ